MRVCIAGKNDIAVAILQTVLEQTPAEEVVVTTNQTETGQDTWQPSLRAFAKRLGVREVKLEELYLIEDLVFLSMEFDQLIRPDAFRTQRLYNIHFSFLPAYKGMFTSAWPILNGEESSGVTLHYIDAGIDTGDIIDQARVVIGPDDTARDLYDSYMEAGISLVLSHLQGLLTLEHRPPARRQPAQGASYYSRRSIDYERLPIDLRKTAWEVHNQIRAFAFREFQMPSLAGHKVWGSRILQEPSRERPGTVVEDREGSITLATLDYYIEVFKDHLPAVIELCKQSDRTGVEALLPFLRSLDEGDQRGHTPLLAAIRAGAIGVVESLLAAGASPTVADWSGVGPLSAAQEYPDPAVSRRLLNLLEEALAHTHYA